MPPSVLKICDYALAATKFWLAPTSEHERGGGCPVTQTGPAPPCSNPTQPEGVLWVGQGQHCSRNSSQKVNVSLLTRSRERRGGWRGSLALCLCCLGSPAGRLGSQQSLCLRQQLGYDCSQLYVGELKRMSLTHRLVGYLRWVVPQKIIYSNLLLQEGSWRGF